jgi:RHS repeat-associated protein
LAAPVNGIYPPPVITQENTYFPFGLEHRGTDFYRSFGLQNQFQYLGREKITSFNLGTYQLGARDFDAHTNRFWSTDPLIDEGQHSFTPYHYSFNNPIRFSDPTGLMGQDCCGDDPSQDPFLFTKLAVTAFYDTKHAIYNTTFRAFGSDLRAGYKVENGNEVFETQFSRKPVDNSLKGGIREAVSAVADVVSIIPGGSTEGKLLAQTSKSQTSRAVKEITAQGAGFVVTPKGEAIKIPTGATGPISPNKGTGMMYQGGNGGKGMDNRVTGVRIMGANKNQGQRVNYMNKEGQTVDPSTGKTIPNNDNRGHWPLKEY